MLAGKRCVEPVVVPALRADMKFIPNLKGLYISKLTHGISPGIDRRMSGIKPAFVQLQVISTIKK